MIALEKKIKNNLYTVWNDIMTKNSVFKLIFMTFLLAIYVIYPLTSFAEEGKKAEEQAVKTEETTKNNTESLKEETISAIELNSSTPKNYGQVDLKQAVNIALDNNRTILEYKWDNKAYRFKLKQQITNYFPTLGATNDYTYNTNINKINLPAGMGLGTGNRNTKSQNQLVISATQPITGLISNYYSHRIAKENYKNSLLDTDWQEESTINDVSNAYFELIKQIRTIEYQKENVKSLEESYKIAYDKYEVGDALARDYMKIQIELENAKHDLYVEENQLNVQLYQFKDLLGINLNDTIDIVQNFEKDNYSDKPVEELQQIAAENRPDLKQKEQDITIAKLNEKLALTDYIPTVDFYTAYYHNYGSSFSVDNNVVLGVNASYNFWEWNKKYFGYKEQKAGTKKAELQLVDAKNQIFIDIQSDLNSIKENNNLIQVSKGNVDLASESLRITKNRYEVGLALVLDLLDDQANLLDSQVQLVTAEVDYQKSLINLKKTLGILKY